MLNPTSTKDLRVVNGGKTDKGKRRKRNGVDSPDGPRGVVQHGDGTTIIFKTVKLQGRASGQIPKDVC